MNQYKENLNYYNEIKSKILKCEIYDKIKNYSKIGIK